MSDAPIPASFQPTIEESILASGAHNCGVPPTPPPRVEAFQPTIEESILASGAHNCGVPSPPPSRPSRVVEF